MARSINFVQSRQKKITQATQKDAKVRLISFGVLGSTVVLFLIAVALHLFHKQLLANLNNRSETVRQAIVQQKDVEVNYTIFIHKLQTLTTLFDQRKDKQEAITYFNNVFGEDVVVREINYSAENQKVSFTIQARDVFTLESVYSVFMSETFKEKYPVVQKTGLRRDNNGSYVMDISVLLDTVDKK